MSSFSDDDYRLFQIHMRSIRSQDCIVFLGPGRRSALADSLLEAFGVNVNEVGRFVTAPDPSVYEAACGRRSDMADRLLKACEINMKKDRRFVTATNPSVYEAACGKSSLTDSFFAPPEIEVQEVAKDVQITDTRVDEVGRGSNNVDQPIDPLGAAGAVLMVCRSCGKKGDHWTSRCPNKDLSKPTEGFVDKPPIAVSNNCAYVPPSLRDGAKRTGGSDMRWRNDENSVRVTNLSEHTREPDLHELFCPFGSVKRVYVAMDKNTDVSRGFGFVNFVSREDAQRAINKLNGYGYDNLILKVEWATPRTT